jgi:Family of unknown function (DUF6941)
MTQVGPEEPEVVALLCDAAQVAGDKLYILGGGWSYLVLPEPGGPVPMAVAARLAIPWNMANRQVGIEVRLVTDDGELVHQEAGPVQATGTMVAGRPAGARPGVALVSPFAIQFPMLHLDYGGYVWEVLIDEAIRARVPFEVRGTPLAGGN